MTTHSLCTVINATQGLGIFNLFFSWMLGFPRIPLGLPPTPAIPSKCDIRSLPFVGHPILGGLSMFEDNFSYFCSPSDVRAE